MDAVLRAIRDGKESQVVGHIAREAPEGKLLEKWAARLKNAEFQFVDITAGLSDLFAAKDGTEIINVKKAAYLASSVMKNVVVPKLEKAIDEERDVTHSLLMRLTEKAILDPTKAGVKLKPECVDICYPPIFQSGGKFDLKPSAVSNDDLLAYDPGSIIICGVGARYNSYCSNIARTYLVDATNLQSKAYEVLLKAHEAAINAMRPGRKLSSVYQAALSVVEKEAPELVDKLTKSAGTGIGLEFRESGLNINARNDKVLRPQMAFNVSLGFQNMECESKKKTFSLFLADTVIVKEEDPEILTGKCSKLVTDAELARRKNEETVRRLAGDGSSGSTAKTSADSVDQKKEAVLLPIYGGIVSFHVSTIRRVSNQQDSIRIIFSVPGTTLKNQGAIYLKEVSFRSKDSKRSSEVVQAIKTLRRQVKARESERMERGTLVNQEKLQLAGNKFRPLRLSGLWIRPQFSGRKRVPGALEAHANGFRYSTTRPNERVDVLFANIKHAFLQPAEKEMLTILHFHLHNHIMVGNKKTKDVQFCVEVMDAVRSLGGGGRRSSSSSAYEYDPDEIHEEQRERDRKNKINVDFNHFATRVSALEFEQPLRELGFSGVTDKARVFIVPTSSCLVMLTEAPFLVVSLRLQERFLKINAIDTTSLEGIKKWLDAIDIKYYESKANLIDSEPEESDQGYEPPDAEDESESEDEDSESESEDQEEEEEDY
ncbi:hypothetical protein HID58_090959 [Brassica napus]|uniref:FACT complex subunit n=1 Tax=Brassica napus TaxID=3708 RepID=A0ABQ7XAC5_BRANA|nr:hypothetical protein HID58_090959 [Brassica napus]